MDVYVFIYHITKNKLVSAQSYQTISTKGGQHKTYVTFSLTTNIMRKSGQCAQINVA